MNKWNLNARYTFEQFTVVEENKQAFQAAEAVVQAPGKAHNPLFLYGPAGMGKTHLLHAVGNRVLQNDAGAAVVYLTASVFAEQCTEWPDGAPSVMETMLQSADVLLLDEIEMLGGKMLAQEVLLDLLESLQVKGKQIVMASARAPQELHGLLYRLQTQVSSGLVARIQVYDVPDRQGIHPGAHSEFAAEHEDLWKRVLFDIKKKIDPDAFATWFIQAQGRETEEGFEVVSPNEFSCDWLEFRYGTLISETLAALSCKKLTIRYLVHEGENCGWGVMDWNKESYATVRKDLHSIRQLTERLLSEQQKTNALLERLLAEGIRT